MTYAESRNRLLLSLTYFSILLFLAATFMSLLYPGPERSMGEVQRLFYIHLGSFFGGFFAFVAALIAGFAYLWTRNPKWDHLGVAGVEVGLALTAITTVTGAIWARPIWGAYWTWDPRLTTIVIMWLTYAAYLFLRTAIEDPEMRRRFSAVYAILAFGSVILTIVIIRVRPDVIHPVVAGPSSNSSDVMGEFEMSGRISQTVLFNIFSYSIIAATLVWYRLRLEHRQEWLLGRKQEVLGRF
jgi:heme exporter protein C